MSFFLICHFAQEHPLPDVVPEQEAKNLPRPVGLDAATVLEGLAVHLQHPDKRALPLLISQNPDGHLHVCPCLPPVENEMIGKGIIHDS